jgi:4-diphosphocytidyl-2-C-methyl-D-erythritol kinase
MIFSLALVGIRGWMRRMEIDAPAKVNPMLRLHGKRADGFHEIETLMVPVGLADRIDISVGAGQGILLGCSDLSLPADASNLAWRAAELFAKETGLAFRTEIFIQKNIPHGAGLGGGSSDAAAVLKALDQLLGTNLGPARLMQMAAALGSDIPFFISCVPAVCRGRGEIVGPAAGIPRMELLLVFPPFPVSTAWAYGAHAAGAGNSATLRRAWGSMELVNDLEPAVFSKYAVLQALRDWLLRQDGVAHAMMSGSGSTVFAILENAAEGLEERLHGEFGAAFSARRCSTVASAV